MKKLFVIAVLMALAMNGFAQEIHYDFSVINSTGYELFYRIVNEQNHWVEVTYPCQNGDNYWWGYDKPEGKLILTDSVTYNGTDYTLIGIDDHAFCGCTGLRGTLEFPESIQAIGTGAFKGCANLNGNLNIPSLVTRIEDETFCGCSGFTGKLYLTDSLTYIGTKAFQQCTFKGFLMLPSTLTVIGDEAFKGCTSFSNISIKAVNPPITGSNAFDEIPTWKTVAVPYTAKDDYQNTSGWSRFANHIVEKSYWNGKAEPWTKGSGTTDDPYLIESAENLAWLAKSVNEKQDLIIDTCYSIGGGWYLYYHFYDVYAFQDTCFKVVIDIDLKKDDGLFWNPIGGVCYINQNSYDGPVTAPHHINDAFNNPIYYCYLSFAGRFDGNNHSIDNYRLYINSSSNHVNQYQGLFGMVYEANICNIYANNFHINIQKGCHTGGIVGNGTRSTITNCHLSGKYIAGSIEYNNGGGYIGGIAGTARACRIENCTVQAHFNAYTSIVGGIVAQMIADPMYNQNDGIFNCSYCGIMDDLSGSVGGIIGRCSSTTENKGVIRVQHCFSRGSMTKGYLEFYGEMRDTKFGGIIGSVLSIDTLNVLNCYSNDTLTGNASTSSSNNAIAGGIIGQANATTTLYVKNSYHVGPITSKYKGGILAQNTNMTIVRNCFFDRAIAPDDGFGLPLESDYMKTEAFVQQLNNGSSVFRMDTEPYENDGYPIFGTDGLIFVGAEWYYQLQNEDGSITYQHLQCVGDTTIGTERPRIIVRTNTIYDRHDETTVTHEYVYEENGVVYWWNQTLGKFTVLYDFGAEVGDEWTIEVGNETITTKVYATEVQYINGIPYKKLTIADPYETFNGNLLSTIGHTTSFFPERLMNRSKGYRVEGLRCYWIGDELVYHDGDEDCDAIYAELHNGINEDGPSTGSGTFTVYPNPTNGILFVETRRATSLPDPTYRITNLMGQTCLTGNISAEIQQINISTLPAGMYFISVDETIWKFVKR